MTKDKKEMYDEIAVAVKYNFGTSGEAPKIVASGRGWLARKILDEAAKHRVPTHREKDLADALVKIPVGLEIPIELWEAMAEVLAHLYKLDGSMGRE